MNPAIKPKKLFVGSCTALLVGGMLFAILSAIMNPLKQQFLLTNLQVGWIGGAGLWGFPISILIFGPLCSVLGIRFLLRLSFTVHLLGAILMMSATNFWMLFFGALIIAFGNGLVEGACNPLVATLFPDQKTAKLNQFHVWFPGGIVVGGLLCYFLDMMGITSWRVKIATLIIPTLVYGYIMIMEEFPQTERAQSGISFGQMIKETLGRPLFILLFICMMMTASVELGPNRWISAILEAGGFTGILVLVWTNVLMATLRNFAGFFAKKLTPVGMLLCSAILSGIGLYMLSYAERYVTIFIADTVFAVGICYFWSTMLGVTSERVPKGGEFALALLGAAGNLAVGLITIPLMGRVADYYGHEKFDAEKTIAIVREANEFFPKYIASKPEGEKGTEQNTSTLIATGILNISESEKAMIEDLLKEAKEIENYYNAEKKLPEIRTAQFLRTILLLAPEDSPISKSAKELLNPADLHGGRIALRFVPILCIILTIIFGSIFIRDRMQGGYKAEKITA